MGCPLLCRHRPGHSLLLSIPSMDDFHFRVLAFQQCLSTCFYLNLALPMQKIQITIRTMGVEYVVIFTDIFPQKISAMIQQLFLILVNLNIILTN